MGEATDAGVRLERWRSRQVVLALVVPLGSAALAFMAWALSERLQFWGPFDRATFAWAVIVPLWVGGAAVTAWLWSFLKVGARTRLAAAVFGIESLFVAATFWFVVVSETQGCETSPRSTAGEFVVPAILVGIVIGATPALAALMAAREFAASRPGRAVVLTIGTFVAGVVLFALAFTFTAFAFGGCNRP